ncbi:hypothetical protein RB653_008229 [Dictyostelium firmibasis]|uniref:Transmembrane protein n=1 Tax=Dictyostelium firmibasis TaxID=79012 RepID=A0AAN7YWG3_9MYCE
MINNLISKRLLTINNSKKLFLNSQSQLYSYSNKNRFFSTNNNNNNNKDKNEPVFSNNNEGESYSHMYEVLKNRLEESEKAVENGLNNSKDLEFFKNKLSTKQIYISRHGTIALIFACIFFTGTLAYFYFGKRKHILLSQQADYHTTAISNELNELTNENQKIIDSLSTSNNQDQLINLLIDKILIEKGIINNGDKSIQQSELNKIKSELKSIIVNNINK